MRQRVLAGGAAVGIAAVVVIVALVAGGGGGGPGPLPVLGGSGVGEAATADAMSTMPAGGSGGPRYELTGDASGLATEADAWSVAREDGEGQARALAEALGLGEVTPTPEGWTAGDDDGLLSVEDQPGLPWYHNAVVGQVDPVPPDTPVSSDGSGGAGRSGVGCTPPADDTGTADADPATTCVAPSFDCAMPECPPGTACTQVCPEPGPDGSVEPVPTPEPRRPADLPSAEEAEVIARGFLDDAGMSLDGARTRVDDGFSSWVFVADPVVGGLPTFGMTTSVGVGSGGVVEFANGWLADPGEGDTYGLVGVDAALDHLAETGSWFAYAPASPDDCPDCEELPEPEPTELDSVEVALQLVPAYGGEEAWLVPSYLFAIADGGPGAVVAAFALADEHLVEPQVDEPVLIDGGDPEPIPVEPNGGIGAGVGPPMTSVEEATAAPLPEGERAVVGVGYYLDISTHCGVRLAAFDGRLWDASPMLGNGNPPPGWAEPTEGGSMTLLAPDEAEFVGDRARTKVARFVSRPADAEPPAECE